jgi:hypothetical protein
MTDVICIPFYDGIPPIAIRIVVFEISELEGVRMRDGKPLGREGFALDKRTVIYAQEIRGGNSPYTPEAAH